MSIWKDTHSIFLETEKLLMESIIQCDPHIAMNSSKSIYEPLPPAPTQPASTLTTPSPHQSCTPETQYPKTGSSAVTIDKPNLVSEPLRIQCLDNEKALQILHICKVKNYEQRRCKNVSRGCPVNTFCTLIDLHEDFCPLNISIKMKVEGNINLLSTTNTKFKPFCKTFLKKYNVLFLSKKNCNDNGIKIYVASYKKRYKFTITFLSKQLTIVHRIIGLTNCDLFRLSAQIMDTHGPLLRYHIKLQK